MSRATSIPSRTGFLRARNHGLKAVSRGLVMQVAPNYTSEWRVGFTATKKIGNAVTRNRARRRLRAAMRESLNPLARAGLDYVMIARHETAKLEWHHLVGDVKKAVGYLHRQMDRQNVEQRGSRRSSDGGQG